METQYLHKLLIGSFVALLSGCTGNEKVDTRSTETTRQIQIGGSSESYEPLKLLVEAYQASGKQDEFNFLPPSQTSGGLQGVKNQTLDVGGISTVLTTDKLGDALQYVPIAKTPLVVVVHGSVEGLTDISADAIRAVYRGDITNWQDLGGPNARIVLFDFAEDENEKKVLRQAYLGDSLTVTSAAVVFPEDDGLLNVAAITEFSIAIVPYENKLQELPMRVLSIDGVTPSSANIHTGEYLMSLSLGIVVAKTSAPEVEAFIEFVTSPEAKKSLQRDNYIVK